MTKSKTIKAIGKYRVLGILGSGRQGVVLCAVDPMLKRKVAIKVLRGNASEEDSLRSIAEARNVSQLRHPNVVTLLDFGMAGKRPYLVFELLNGTSLREELGSKGSLGVRRSVVLMSQILGGIGAAHSNGIAHCDLSTNNIILTSDDLPKVMDFGLSSAMNQRDNLANVIAGTPRYMSPELLKGEPASFQSDVFSLGAIFYHMLTGEPQFNQTTSRELFGAIIDGEPRLPSLILDETPPVIDEIIACALSRDLRVRFSNAQTMKSVLDEYRIPRRVKNQQRHSTVDFLMRRLKYAAGFSALSSRIDDVLKMTASDSNSDARKIANLLAKDITLSGRVLTMANSAMYGGKEVPTLSQAIVLMGLTQVRHCVTCCLMQGHFSEGSSELRCMLVRAYFAATLAKLLAFSLQIISRENAFLGGMFHSLGRMLVLHYLPEEYQLIRERSTDRESEFTNCREVLGLPFHEAGQQVAQYWKLPDQIIRAMTPFPRGNLEESDISKCPMVVVASFSNAVTDLAGYYSSNSIVDILHLLERARTVIPVEPSEFWQIIATALDSARKYAAITGASRDAGEFIGSLDKLILSAEEEAERTQGQLEITIQAS